MQPLTIATFNIDNIGKRLPVLREWLTKASPDEPANTTAAATEYLNRTSHG